MPKLSTNFKAIISRDYANFEEQNKVLETSIITINYCIIINAHHNYIALLMHSKNIVFLRKASLRNALRKKI